MRKVTILVGRVEERCRELEPRSFAAVLSDPPYGLSSGKTKTWDDLAAEGKKGRGFMGNAWDAAVPGPSLWREVFRVLKPGAAMIAFFGTRTYHRGVVAIEDAGFEVRDMLTWNYACLSEDTEILVDGKWEPYHRAKRGRLALCYDIETDEYSWQPIRELFVYPYDDVAYRIRSESTDQIVTRNHRCLVERGGAYAFEIAENLASESEARVPVLEGLPILLGALSVLDEGAGRPEQALLPRMCGGYDKCVSYGEAFASEAARKLHVHGMWEGIREAPSVREDSRYRDSVVLESMQWKPACHRDAPASEQAEVDGRETCRIPEKDGWRWQPGLEGRSYDIPEARELCRYPLRAVPGEISGNGASRWVRDGASIDRRESSCAATFEKRSGASRKSQSARQSPGKPGSFREQSRSQAVRASRFTRADLARVEPCPYQGIVWCVQVPTGAFVARRNGKVFVTGNSGFPKSHDVSKALDDDAGANRKVVGTKRGTHAVDASGLGGVAVGIKQHAVDVPVTEPATDLAKAWDGYGTALKPSLEPAVLARVPMEGTIAENVAKHGTGALAIDACRVGTGALAIDACRVGTVGGTKGASFSSSESCTNKIYGKRMAPTQDVPAGGRWPANSVFDEGAAASLDAQSGDVKGMASGGKHREGYGGGMFGGVDSGASYGDRGGVSRMFYRVEADPEAPGASRFYYTSKSSRKERGPGNDHPCVKPVDLCRYFARLILPPVPGAILVPFSGSGSEIVGCLLAGWQEVVGIDMDAAYAKKAAERIREGFKKNPVEVEVVGGERERSKSARSLGY